MVVLKFVFILAVGWLKLIFQGFCFVLGTEMKNLLKVSLASICKDVYRVNKGIC